MFISLNIFLLGDARVQYVLGYHLNKERYQNFFHHFLQSFLYPGLQFLLKFQHNQKKNQGILLKYFFPLEVIFLKFYLYKAQAIFAVQTLTESRNYGNIFFEIFI